MAIWTTRTRTQLGRSYVLAPERYDPRRDALLSESTAERRVPLGSIARSVRSIVQPSTEGLERCLILDTSDAQEGIIVGCKSPIPGDAMGSAKKVIQPNDVIISRLRPYLRQVAFVDDGIRNWAPGITMVCSTEFFVLRSVDSQSIAFLVPFLLSEPVQKVLAASQEGGHHPRFDEATLLTLPLPGEFLDARDGVSRGVEASVRLYRESERGLAAMVASAGSIFSTSR